jgi:hypothetical protein
VVVVAVVVPIICTVAVVPVVAVVERLAELRLLLLAQRTPEVVVAEQPTTPVVPLVDQDTYTITLGAGLTGSTATSGSEKITTITAGSDTVSWA